MSGFARRETWIFCALVFLYAAPLWVVDQFPSQDGPIHLSVAHDLVRLHAEPESRLAEYLALNPRIEPNWGVYAALAPLDGILPPLVSERVLLTVYALLFAFGARYATSAMAPGGGTIAFLFLPFGFAYFIHMGFYNFSLGCALCFWTLGVWLRGRAQPTMGRTLLLAGLGLALSLTHLFPFLVLVCIVGGLILASERGPGRRLLAALAAGVWLAPGAWVVGGFFLEFGITAGSAEGRLGRHLGSLLELKPLIAYGRSEYVFVAPYALLLVWLLGLAGVRRVRSRGGASGDGFLWLALVLLALSLFDPLQSAGGLVHERLLVAGFFSLFLWLAAFGWSPRERVLVVAVLSGCIGLQSAQRVQSYRRWAPVLAEYRSAAAWIEPDSTLLPLRLGRRVTLVGEKWEWAAVDPLRHAAGHFAWERDAVVLGRNPLSPGAFPGRNGTDHTPFPVSFRPERDPHQHMRGVENRREVPRIFEYEEQTGGRVDNILILAGPEVDTESPYSSAVLEQLEAGYELVHQSSPRGIARLYRRR